MKARTGLLMVAVRARGGGIGLLSTAEFNLRIDVSPLRAAIVGNPCVKVLVMGFVERTQGR